MELIVDANILFAALIKVSVTSDMIVENSLHLIQQNFFFQSLKSTRS